MEPKKTKKRNGVLGKGLMVLLIACVLQIPILLVKGLIEDRKELSNNVQTELTSSLDLGTYCLQKEGEFLCWFLPVS